MVREAPSTGRRSGCLKASIGVGTVTMMKRASRKSRRIGGVVDVDGGQFRAADFAGGIDAAAQLIDLLRTDVEADDRGFLRKGHRQREADITETDQGDLGLTGGDLFYCDHFFLQNHH